MVDKGTGIQWTSEKNLEDLEFADDLALLSHSVNDMQVKTQDLEASAALMGLRINKDKTEIMKVKTEFTGSHTSKWLNRRSPRIHIPGKCGGYDRRH